MFKQLTLTLMLATLVNSSALAETLNGQVSIDRRVTDSKGAINQETEEPIHAEEVNAEQETDSRMAITVQQYKTSPVELDSVMNLLRRAVRGENSSRLRAQNPLADKNVRVLEGRANQELSALGVEYTFPSDVIIAVDPASDLAGKVVAGDRFLAVDGIAPFESHLKGSNLGNAGTIAQVTFSHEGVIQTLPCRRQPIQNFSIRVQDIMTQLGIPDKDANARALPTAPADRSVSEDSR